jgi:Tol biopolymer transport system component/DNA-binding winged helix-turn-helix (wHTH) protein
MPRLTRFGPFELDAQTAELRKHGVRIRLHEQPFRILLALLQRPGEVVLREEIRKTLWPNDTVVEFDHSINSAIQRLRTSLSDSAEHPRYVETVARRGYRFVGTVEAADPELPGKARPPAVLSESDLDPGDLTGRTLSHFRFIGELGRGGMGVVYRAEDLRLGRQVALKFLPFHVEKCPQAMRERFQQEARAAAVLNHPNICTIHGVEELAGQPVIEMELIEGETLAAHLARGPLPIGKALAAAIQIAAALEEAHRKGIVHRDLKPANIMLTPAGVKVLDFGLAQVERPTATGDGGAGTPRYMSPEQASGKTVDSRTDIWAFGLVLFEMLTGKPLFGAARQDEPDWSALPAETPPNVRHLLTLCVRKEPELRLRDIGAARVILSEPDIALPSVLPLLRRFPFRWAAVLAAIAIVAGGWWLVSRSSQLPPKVAAIRQITKSAAADLWPSFSPDGSQIAFSSDRSGHFEIYVRSLAPDGTERQLTSDGQENIEPAWSPDGRYLAYAVRQHGGVRIVPVSGGPIRYVAETGNSPQWSPDGRTLAITLYNMDDTISPKTGVSPDSVAILGLVDAGGGRVRPLIGGDRPPFNPAFPRWLADGRHIVFVSMTWNTTLWVIDSETREARRIDAGKNPRSPVFSADLRDLYFAEDAAKIRGIWRARTGRDWKVESSEPLIPFEGASLRGLTISADGSRIAFSREVGDSGIWSVPVDSHGVAAGEPTPLIRDRSDRNTHPHFSADGSRIAWSSFQEGGEKEVIYVADADGSSPEAVTPTDQRSGRPQWVGKDLTLAYQVQRHGERSYWVAPPRGKPEPVHPTLDLVHADQIRTSSDGAMLAAQVTTKRGLLQIVVAGLRGGPAHTLTPADRDIGFPFWSPDGRWIAAEERKAGATTLVVIPSKGGEIRTLASEFRQYYPYDWSPDGDRIAFAGLDRGTWNLYWISFSTGKVEQLTHFTAQSGFVRYPSWSPKGDRIIFERNDLTSNIYVADLSSSGK